MVFLIIIFDDFFIDFGLISENFSFFGINFETNYRHNELTLAIMYPEKYGKSSSLSGAITIFSVVALFKKSSSIILFKSLFFKNNLRNYFMLF